MFDTRRLLEAYVLTALSLGVGIGAVGLLSVNWAQTTYIARASGQTVETFGPILVGLVVFQNAVVALIVGLGLSFVFGLLFASKVRERNRAIAVGAVGGLCNQLMLVSLAIAVPLVAARSFPTFGVGSAVVPLVGSALVAGVVGSVAGYLGSQF